MQRVIHEYRNKSRLFTQIEQLYTYISDTEFMYDDILWLDDVFADVCQILQEKLLMFRTPTLKNFDMPVFDVPVKDKEIIVCLSGGKDSAACAYYYVKKGYKVHLYHMHGVNKAYGDEQKAAKRIADYLGCDLYTETIKLAGIKPDYIEHPLKNYIIANGAIHYALAKGYSPVIATGNFNQSKLDMNEFEICGGDCVEMWDAYEKIIRKIIPNFRVEIPLATNADTFNLLADDWELFSLAVSCMSPYRFREHWKHRTEQQYNIKLFDSRCGCCWKCCVEAIWLMDTGKMDYNEKYYLHSLGILAMTLWRESDIQIFDIDTIWENYMWYDMKESKAYDILKNCTIKYTTKSGAARILF